MYYVMLCYVMLCYIMLCYVMLHRGDQLTYLLLLSFGVKFVFFNDFVRTHFVHRIASMLVKMFYVYVFTYRLLYNIKIYMCLCDCIIDVKCEQNKFPFGQ